MCIIVGHAWIIPNYPYLYEPIYCSRCGKRPLPGEWRPW